MKLEKRNASGSAESMEDAAPKGKKPVVVYIMILFIAAFLLMAWSFASHQRSNTEVLGRLQSSVSAIQEVQELQDQVIALQKELAEAKETADIFQEANETSRNQASNMEEILRRTREAMEWFWQLDEAYLKDNAEICRTILTEMEKNKEAPMKDYLTELSAERYEEIKAAMNAMVENGVG